VRGPVSASGLVTLLLLATLAAIPSALSAAPRSPDPKKEALRSQKLPEGAPADFASLRQRADALAVGQDAAFRLHQVEVELESATLRIKQAAFRYFQPLRGEWEQLLVGVSTGGRIRMGQTLGKAYPGSIGASRTTLAEPPPTAAPARLIAPEDAIRALGRAALTGAFGPPGRGSGPSYLRDPSQWGLFVQLAHTGATHQAGNVELSPLRDFVPWVRRYIQPARDDSFFQKTAPRNAWVWWTVLQAPDAPEERFEYVYMDPATGKATSACAVGAGRRGEGTWQSVACGR